MTKSIHKQQIFELRSQGKTYNEIQSILGCSKATISYHLGEGRKEKVLSYQREKRSETHPLIRKIQTFIYKIYESSKERELKTPLHKRISFTNPVRSKIKRFLREGPDDVLKRVIFTPEELIRKTGTVCYLTGRNIDLTNSKSYQLDHKIARSKGGPNTLENCELTCSEANFAKGQLSLEEFFQLCIDVVKHNKLM